jgi:hypothetical protein
LAAGAFLGWMALETYVLSQRIHLLTSELRLRVGMTQNEVEDLLGVKPEDRKAPDPDLAGAWPPRKHEGIKRFSEARDGNGTYVNLLFPRHPHC